MLRCGDVETGLKPRILCDVAPADMFDHRVLNSQEPLATIKQRNILVLSFYHRSRRLTLQALSAYIVVPTQTKGVMTPF
jgi:hypothetical protein